MPTAERPRVELQHLAQLGRNAHEKLKPLGKLGGILLLMMALNSDTIDSPPDCPPLPEPPPGFAYVDNGKLYVDDRELRIVGPNIYWLSLDFRYNDFLHPSQQRIDDILQSAADMGSTVVRTHGLISLGCDICMQPDLGVFNEDGFAAMDYAVYRAGQLGLKLIAPLGDNWDYKHGGMRTFLRWRGLRDDREFFTNPAVIQDFKDYITFVLNHVNPYTGKRYADDETFLAWETGNEWTPPYGMDISAWTAEIVAHLYSIDKKHLIADGQSANFGQGVRLNQESLSNCYISLVSEHAYPLIPNWTRQNAEIAHRYGKVYFIGEYGEVDYGIPMPTYLPAHPEEVMASLLSGELKYVNGMLFWSLFGAAERYGVVEHFDGFAQNYPSTNTLGFRDFAFALLQAEKPPLRIPSTPLPFFTETLKGKGLVWHSSQGNLYYRVEGSVDNETWTELLSHVTDRDLPLFPDEYATQFAPTYIRVFAVNPDQVASDPSPVIQVP